VILPPIRKRGIHKLREGKTGKRALQSARHPPPSSERGGRNGEKGEPLGKEHLRGREEKGEGIQKKISMPWGKRLLHPTLPLP